MSEQVFCPYCGALGSGLTCGHCGKSMVDPETLMRRLAESGGAGGSGALLGGFGDVGKVWTEAMGENVRPALDAPTDMMQRLREQQGCLALAYTAGFAYLPGDYHARPAEEQARLLECVLGDVSEYLRCRIRVGTPDQIEDLHEHLAQVARVWLPGTDYLMLDADIRRLLPHCSDPMWIAALCVGPAAGMYESAERIEGAGVLLKNRRGQYGITYREPADPPPLREAFERMEARVRESAVQTHQVEPIPPLPDDLYKERGNLIRDMERLSSMEQVERGDKRP